MKSVNLDIWERMQLLNICKSQTPGRTSTIADVRNRIRLIDILELTEKEGKEVGLTLDGVRFEWTNDAEYGLDFEDADFSYLIELVNGYQYWPIDTKSIDLVDKINGD